MSKPVLSDLDSGQTRSIKEVAYGLIECWNAMDFHRAYRCLLYTSPSPRDA